MAKYKVVLINADFAIFDMCLLYYYKQIEQLRIDKDSYEQVINKNAVIKGYL